MDVEPDQLEPSQPKVQKAVSPSENSEEESEVSDAADEEDGEGGRTESEDEDEQVNKDDLPGETVTLKGPETRNPELVDNANNT